MKDERYEEAVKLVKESGKVSTSYLQRQMRIGYNRAATLFDDMEKEGVITPFDSFGKRSLVESVERAVETAGKICDIAEKTGQSPDEVFDKASEMIGHNSGETPHSSVTKAAIRGESKDVGGVAGQRLSSFVERVERLEEEKAALMEDIKEVYAEAKGVGFDVKQIRKLVTLRKMDTEKRHEEEAILDLYKSAIGML